MYCYRGVVRHQERMELSMTSREGNHTNVKGKPLGANSLKAGRPPICNFPRNRQNHKKNKEKRDVVNSFCFISKSGTSFLTTTKRAHTRYQVGNNSYS